VDVILIAVSPVHTENCAVFTFYSW